jgi:hypothetical protein
MKIELIRHTQAPYSDTDSFYRVIGCTGKTDAEIKKFIGWVDHPDFWDRQYITFRRESEDVATYMTTDRYDD